MSSKFARSLFGRFLPPTLLLFFSPSIFLCLPLPTCSELSSFRIHTSAPKPQRKNKERKRPRSFRERRRKKSTNIPGKQTGTDRRRRMCIFPSLFLFFSRSLCLSFSLYVSGQTISRGECLERERRRHVFFDVLCSPPCQSIHPPEFSPHTPRTEAEEEGPRRASERNWRYSALVLSVVLLLPFSGLLTCFLARERRSLSIHREKNDSKEDCKQKIRLYGSFLLFFLREEGVSIGRLDIYTSLLVRERERRCTYTWICVGHRERRAGQQKKRPNKGEQETRNRSLCASLFPFPGPECSRSARAFFKRTSVVLRTIT